MKKDTSRRSFLRKAALSSAAFTAVPFIAKAAPYEQKFLLQRNHESFSFSANDHIQLALIGSGIQGIYDTTAALKVDGVKWLPFAIYTMAD